MVGERILPLARSVYCFGIDFPVRPSSGRREASRSLAMGNRAVHSRSSYRPRKGGACNQVRIDICYPPNPLDLLTRV